MNSNIAEIEVVYKSGRKSSEQPKISNAHEAYQVLISHWDENKIELVEQARMLLLNRANRVLGINTISTGGVSGTILDPKLVFATALKANACSIILAHNHPSGNLNPSLQDKQITQRLTDAGKLLDIEVIDHLIVTRDGYYSFAEEKAHNVNSSLGFIRLEYTGWQL